MAHRAVRTLKGQSVVFTGIVRDDNGTHVKRVECFRLARKAGATYTSEDISLGSTVLVQGDLSSKKVAHKKTGQSSKLATVAEWRREGHHVHVIDSVGFFALLAGHQALCRDLIGRPADPRPKPEPGDDIFGGLLNPHDGGKRTSGGPLAMDLAKLDAGSRAHQETLKKLINHLGDVPVRTPRPGGPLFDAGWSNGRVLYIAEVKSLTGTNQAQQIRLGLGQVLDYHHQLGGKSNMKPVLVLQQRPTDVDLWAGLTDRHGVLLTWGPDFPGVE